MPSLAEKMPRRISLPPRALLPKSGMAKSSALGKGLSALMGTPKNLAAPVPAEEKGESIRQVARNAIVPSPLQPRKNFKPEELNELVDSIKERGVIQPLIVRLVNGKYELIAGERRWRAAAEAGLDTLPVIVREASNRDVLELALIENLQRADLNPIEEAEAYARLMKEFSLTQEQVAHQVGKGEGRRRQRRAAPRAARTNPRLARHR